MKDMFQYDFHGKTLPEQIAYKNFPFEPEILVSYCIYPVSEVSAYNNTAYIRRFIHHSNNHYHIPWYVTSMSVGSIDNGNQSSPIDSVFIVYNISLYTLIQLFRAYDPQDSMIDTKESIEDIAYHTSKFLSIVGMTKDAFAPIVFNDFMSRYGYDDIEDCRVDEWPSEIMYNDTRITMFQDILKNFNPRKKNDGYLASPYYIEASEMLVNVTYEKYLGKYAVNMNAIAEDKLYGFLSDLYSDIATIDGTLKTNLAIQDNRVEILDALLGDKLTYVTTDYSTTYIYNHKSPEKKDNLDENKNKK